MLPEKADPANPERFPEVYAPVHCAVCRRCWAYRLIGRCMVGGPFNADYRVDRAALVVL